MSNSCFHGKQSILFGDGIHSPISFVYVNSAARLSASGFIESDGYKLAIELDTQNIYVLVNWISPTWSALGGPGSDSDAFHNSVSGEIVGITLKALPISGDLLLIEDSADSNNKKSITIGTLPVGGDVSGTISNIQLATNSVDSNEIINDAVTFAKMQNITTDKLLGRDTVSTGDPEEIDLNSTLEFTGTGSIQRAALTGDVAASAGSNATTIASGAVTFAKMQNVSTDILVGRDSSGSGVLTEITLAATLVFTGSNSIGRATISGDIDISAGSNTAAIATGVIVNADINSSAAIALSKLQNITTDRLLGRDTTATGAIEEISVGGGIEFSGSTAIQRSALTGDITASAGSNTTAIAVGVIVNADINSSAAIAVSKLAPSSIDGYVLTTNAGVAVWASNSASITTYRYVYNAYDMLTPNNSNWVVNAFASLAVDSINAALPIRRFDDTTDEGVGFGMSIPTGMTNIILYFKSRAQTAPGGTSTVTLDLYRRTIGDNTTPSSWSAATALTSISIPTNTNFQYDSQSLTLSGLSLTAGNYVQFELVRSGGTLSGDWVLLEIIVEFT